MGCGAVGKLNSLQITTWVVKTKFIANNYLGCGAVGKLNSLQIIMSCV